MKPSPGSAVLIASLVLASCGKHETHVEQRHKVVSTSPLRQDITVTEEYVCQIHSCRHIEMRALEGGYLEKVLVKEGQGVKAGDLLFKIVPTLYQAELEAEKAELDAAQAELETEKAEVATEKAEVAWVTLESQNTRKLVDSHVVSENELALVKAKLGKAQAQLEKAEAKLGRAQAQLGKAKAKAALSQAHLDFTDIKAPFTGISGPLRNREGSLIGESEVLTTLSDNGTMWVYFNVPEARYLQYASDIASDNVLKVELLLANGQKFGHEGKISAIEADFNNETGNISFRADFPNPERLLRHGQTGMLLIHRPVKDAVVIPQRATFEILDKRYVYVVGDDGVVHQRKITVQNELEDRYVVKEGLDEKDRIVLDGVREVQDGEKAECEFKGAEEAMKELKYEAE